MSEELSRAVRERLDSHLDAVEQVLIEGGQSREQRRAVVDDLESQIVEMLLARSSTPTSADVEAVLRQIDPPNAYGAALVDSQSVPSPAGGGATAISIKGGDYSVAGIASLVIFCTAGIAELALVCLAMTGFSPSSDWRSVFSTVALLAALAVLGGAIAGLVGVLQKRRRRTPAALGLILNGLVLLASLTWLMWSDRAGQHEAMTVDPPAAQSSSGRLKRATVGPPDAQKVPPR